MQESNEEIFLFLDLPKFEHAVIFNNLIPGNNERNIGKDIVIINDFEQSPSPVEMKHLKLARRSSIYDKDLKPDQSERQLIDVRFLFRFLLLLLLPSPYPIFSTSLSSPLFPLPLPLSSPLPLPLLLLSLFLSSLSSSYLFSSYPILFLFPPIYVPPSLHLSSFLFPFLYFSSQAFIKCGNVLPTLPFPIFCKGEGRRGRGRWKRKEKGKGEGGGGKGG